VSNTSEVWWNVTCVYADIVSLWNICRKCMQRVVFSRVVASTTASVTSAARTDIHKILPVLVPTRADAHRHVVTLHKARRNALLELMDDPGQWYCLEQQSEGSWIEPRFLIWTIASINVEKACCYVYRAHLVSVPIVSELSVSIITQLHGLNTE